METIKKHHKLILLTTGILFVGILSLLTPKIIKAPAQPAPSPPQVKAVEKKTPVVPQVSLAKIFSEKEPDLSQLDQSKIVTLIATGDVIPARGAAWPATSKNDFNYNWEATAVYLKTGDITLINLEAPLVKGCPLVTSGFKFCADSRQVQGMLYAGIDVANLMNNHIGNFGQAGISETEKTLDDNHILWSGFSNLAIKEVKGKKFGFLGYNGVGVHIDRQAVVTEVANAKKKVDVLVVSIHWGKEYEAMPMTDGNIAPDNPAEIGHLIIDSGADLIVGNHPHWVQGVELYKDKFIAYAHGNFIFDQTWSEETQEGVVGTYTFYDGKLVVVHYKPIVVDKSYQPKFVSGAVADKIIKQMQNSSNQLAKTQAK